MRYTLFSLKEANFPIIQIIKARKVLFANDISATLASKFVVDPSDVVDEIFWDKEEAYFDTPEYPDYSPAGAAFCECDFTVIFSNMPAPTFLMNAHYMGH